MSGWNLPPGVIYVEQAIEERDLDWKEEMEARERRDREEASIARLEDEDAGRRGL